jgi:hypothetical protein
VTDGSIHQSIDQSELFERSSPDCVLPDGPHVGVCSSLKRSTSIVVRALEAARMQGKEWCGSDGIDGKTIMSSGEKMRMMSAMPYPLFFASHHLQSSCSKD